ncbi:OAZ1 [Cordylochernes scorpioides]|uniref:Ornithine decarboxylase antizyme n=1 Tax=Cordylochernes scorpioides TaxID=51811 RepID=A0ABY6KJK2_9ARAC|nr:OAZ1 [Cordylochernes scorpioides]
MWGLLSREGGTKAAPDVCAVVICATFVSLWGRGLGGAPDEPHAVSLLSPEGSGVGTSKTPPAVVPPADGLVTFKLRLAESTALQWQALLWQRRLYLQLPPGPLQDGSKEALVALLEYAEEELHCSHVLVCFQKDRPDKVVICATSVSLWGRGLGGAPDEPHAVSLLSPEGSGVGTSKTPPAVVPSADGLVTFKLRLAESTALQWQALLWQRRLYLQLPPGPLQDGSKEALVALLEYAEEELHCSHVLVCFQKDRPDKALYMADINPEEDIHTDKASLLAGIVIRVHGPI